MLRGICTISKCSQETKIATESDWALQINHKNIIRLIEFWLHNHRIYSLIFVIEIAHCHRNAKNQSKIEKVYKVWKK